MLFFMYWSTHTPHVGSVLLMILTVIIYLQNLGHLVNSSANHYLVALEW